MRSLLKSMNKAEEVKESNRSHTSNADKNVQNYLKNKNADYAYMFSKLWPNAKEQKKRSKAVELARKAEQEKEELSKKLTEIEKEIDIKEILGEHTLYAYSTKRFLTDATNPVEKPSYGGPIQMGQANALVENREIKLITREALEQIQMAKQLNLNKKINIPTVTFLINNIVLFSFQGV